MVTLADKKSVTKTHMLPFVLDYGLNLFPRCSETRRISEMKVRYFLREKYIQRVRRSVTMTTNKHCGLVMFWVGWGVDGRYTAALAGLIGLLTDLGVTEYTLSAYCSLSTE